MHSKTSFCVMCVMMLLIATGDTVILARLCARMTPCDLNRLLRSHAKQILAVNEKTIRVDFLTNELQTGGKDLTQRVDIIEGKYFNLSELVVPLLRPYTTDFEYRFYKKHLNITDVKLNDIMEDDWDSRNSIIEPVVLESKTEEVNGDYKQSIKDLSDSHKQLHESFLTVKADLEDLKNEVTLSVSGTRNQSYELQHLREEINQAEEMTKTTEKVLKNHFEELVLIRDHLGNSKLSAKSELNHLVQDYSELESRIYKLATKLKDKADARRTVSQETSDIRYTYDELEALKSSMAKVTDALRETEQKCINKGFEIGSKINRLYRRIKDLNSRRSPCRG